MADPLLVVQYASAEMWRRRKESGLTREETVARMSDPISPRALASWEQGTRRMYLGNYLLVCHALDVSAPGILRAAQLRADFGDRCECCGEVRGGG